MTNSPTFIKFLLSVLCLLATLSFAGTNKPNVILIYTDDHGYTDLGVHGIDKHVDTPKPLDQSAYRGYRAGPRQYNPRIMD